MCCLYSVATGVAFSLCKSSIRTWKHVFVEKPSTISYEQTSELVEIAKQRNLVLQENYMFQYHAQIAEIRKLLKEGLIGDIRLMKVLLDSLFVQQMISDIIKL